MVFVYIQVSLGLLSCLLRRQQDLPQREERSKGKVCVPYSFVLGLHRVKFQVILPVGKEGGQKQFVKSYKAYQKKQMSFSLHTLSTQSVRTSA